MTNSWPESGFSSVAQQKNNEEGDMMEGDMEEDMEGDMEEDMEEDMEGEEAWCGHPGNVDRRGTVIARLGTFLVKFLG